MVSQVAKWIVKGILLAATGLAVAVVDQAVEEVNRANNTVPKTPNNSEEFNDKVGEIPAETTKFQDALKTSSVDKREQVANDSAVGKELSRRLENSQQSVYARKI